MREETRNELLAKHACDFEVKYSDLPDCVCQHIEAARKFAVSVPYYAVMAALIVYASQIVNVVLLHIDQSAYSFIVSTVELFLLIATFIAACANCTVLNFVHGRRPAHPLDKKIVSWILWCSKKRARA